MTGPPHVRQATDYLSARGWAPTDRWRGGTVWSWRDFDVLVPPGDDLADTPRRMRDLVECVADAEGRTPRAVERDMAVPAVDVVSYRLRGSGIALPAGVRAVRAVRDLVATCARDVLGDPAGSRAPAEVPALLDRALLSLDESVFGVEVLLPVDDVPEPLGRLTALRVLRVCAVVRQAVVAADEVAFDEVFRQGVGRDVCATLADLAGPHRAEPFELGFRWSVLRPVEGGATTVEFPGGAGERVWAASRRGPAGAPVAAVVEGPVTGLADDEHGERWRIQVRGTPVVDGIATGRERLVPVRLDGERAYGAALEAHRTGRTVRVSGSTHRTGKDIAVDPGGFTVVEDVDG
ncbi:hypothetical protein [Saccharothrix syringae]|uniref:Uncharacterized protein n=1 Tax=Saccharothrix syringae TaxID=103733 RepID=A0A5Q0H0S6_SACSY|nr:hypothetical protein [Saccharothrix syringae]QFZ19370.1 hypothetical protein EKG83_19740 [Saccharothrix syringae]